MILASSERNFIFRSLLVKVKVKSRTKPDRCCKNRLDTGRDSPSCRKPEAAAERFRSKPILLMRQSLGRFEISHMLSTQSDWTRANLETGMNKNICVKMWKLEQIYAVIGAKGFYVLRCTPHLRRFFIFFASKLTPLLYSAETFSSKSYWSGSDAWEGDRCGETKCAERFRLDSTTCSAAYRYVT